jgi:hypothetical protein
LTQQIRPKPLRCPRQPSSSFNNRYFAAVSSVTAFSCLAFLTLSHFAMLALKRIVTVAVMVYLLLALLFILAPAVRTSVMGMGSGLSALEQERQFYYTLFIVGAVLLAVHLITENMDSVLLRRSVSQHEMKINELKAKLYDQQ